MKYAIGITVVLYLLTAFVGLERGADAMGYFIRWLAGLVLAVVFVFIVIENL